MLRGRTPTRHCGAMGAHGPSRHTRIRGSGVAAQRAQRHGAHRKTITAQGDNHRDSVFSVTLWSLYGNAFCCRYSNYGLAVSATAALGGLSFPYRSTATIRYE